MSDVRPTLRRTFSQSNGAPSLAVIDRRLSLSTPKTEVHGSTPPRLTRTNSSSNASKRRIGPVIPPPMVRANSASCGPISRKQANKNLKALKAHPSGSRYSNRSRKDGRSARERNDFEVEDLASQAIESSAFETVRQASMTGSKVTYAPPSPQPPPSTSKTRISWVQSTTARLHHKEHNSIHHRLACWLCVLVSHIVCMALHLFIAKIVTQKPHVSLSELLPQLAAIVTDTASKSTTIAVISGILCAIHMFLWLRMLWQSLRNRQLMYYAPNVYFPPRSDQIMPFSASLRALTGQKTESRVVASASIPSIIIGLVRKTCSIFQELLWSRREFVLLDYMMPSERLYRISLLCQMAAHITNIVLMSKSVSLSHLHRVGVTLMVFNTWLPLTLTMLRNRQALLWQSHRIVSLIASVAVDMYAVLIVPASLIDHYNIDYSSALHPPFTKASQFSDRWITTMLLEIEFFYSADPVLGVCRVFLSLHLLSSLNALKSLLESVASSRPPIPSNERSLSGSPSKTSTRERERPSVIRIKPGTCSILMMEITLMILGTITLAGYLDTQSQVYPAACPLMMRSWFRLKPSCPLVEINCRSDTTNDILDNLVLSIDRFSVRNLVIRSCTSLEVSASLQLLPRLTAMKLRDSELLSWSEDAALTQTLHPELQLFTAVNVKMQELPPGLLSPELPGRLTSIEICGTNVSSLPLNLDVLWPRVVFLELENNEFVTVPDVLARMTALRMLVLGGNGLTSLPVSLLEMETLASLIVDVNPVAQLPADVEVDALRVLSMQSTQLSTLPTWATTQDQLTVFVGSTPYCSQTDLLRTMVPELQGINCTPLVDDSISTKYPFLISDN